MLHFNEPLIEFDMDKIELLQKLAAYVKHSEHVWLNSSSGMAKRVKLPYIDECKSLISRLYKFENTFLIYREINSYKDKLREIMPTYSNPSYESSEQNYIDIINCCRRKLQLPELKTTVSHE